MSKPVHFITDSHHECWLTTYFPHCSVTSDREQATQGSTLMALTLQWGSQNVNKEINRAIPDLTMSLSLFPPCIWISFPAPNTCKTEQAVLAPGFLRFMAKFNLWIVMFLNCISSSGLGELASLKGRKWRSRAQVWDSCWSLNSFPLSSF